jgi:hypothetical protein
MRGSSIKALGILTLLGAAMGLIVASAISKGQALEAAYEKGVEAGMAKAYKSAKEQIEADPNYTRVVCKLWWFGMDHRDRSVK